MAVVPNNTEKIDALLKTTSAFEESLRAINRDLESLRRDLDGAKSQIHNLDTRLARIEESLRHTAEKLDRIDPTDRLIRVEEGQKTLTKELDKLRSNRFEVGKVFLASFFSFMGAGIFFLLNVLVQWLNKLK